MILEFEYTIIGFVIIASLIPLYIYRKEIYKRVYKKGSTKTFMKDCEIFLVSNYPKIKFDFNIESKYQEDEDIRIKQTLLAEDFVNQFINHEYELSTQDSVSKDKLWGGYEAASRPVKGDKRPSDWARRKQTAWNRDSGKCNRCGTKTKLIDSQVLLAKQVEDSGGFNLENIVILCSDCAKVVKSQDIQKISKDLIITDKLMNKVQA